MQVESLYEAHRSALVRYLTRYCGDPDLAEDAAQEAFVRLADRPPRSDENLRGWLFTVATRIALDQVRSSHRRDHLLESSHGRATHGEAPEPPDQAVVRSDLRRLVRTALDELGEKERSVLLMREEGFTHREIAAALDTTSGSVGTMIARALRKLAARLPAGLEDAR